MRSAELSQDVKCSSSVGQADDISVAHSASCGKEISVNKEPRRGDIKRGVHQTIYVARYAGSYFNLNQTRPTACAVGY